MIRKECVDVLASRNILLCPVCDTLHTSIRESSIRTIYSTLSFPDSVCCSSQVCKSVAAISSRLVAAIKVIQELLCKLLRINIILARIFNRRRSEGYLSTTCWKGNDHFIHS